MAPMSVQPPQQDTATMWAIADHAWTIGSGVGGLLIAIVWWFIRRIRWADSITAEIKRVHDLQAVGLEVKETRLDGIADKIDEIRDRQAKWENEVKSQIGDVRDEFRGEFGEVHKRIDNILMNHK